MAKASFKDKNRVLCKQCGAVIPLGDSQCLVCGASINEALANDSTETDQQRAERTSASQLHKDRRLTRAAVILLSLLLLVGGIGAGTVEYAKFQYAKGIFNTKDSLIYQQNDRSLKIQLSSMNEPTLITSDYSNTTGILKPQNSFDDRFIAYLNNQTEHNGGVKGDLHLLDLTQLDAPKDDPTYENKGVQITDDPVVDFLFSPKEKSLVYLTADGNLFACDYRQFAPVFRSRSIVTRQLDREVNGIAGISGQQVLYYKGVSTTPQTLENNRALGTGPSLDLYRISLDKKNPNQVLVDTNITVLLDTARDYSRLLYTKQTNFSKLPEFSIYSYDDQKESKISILAQKVSYVAESSAETGALLYLTANNNTLAFENLFDDSSSDRDNSLQNPMEDISDTDSLTDTELEVLEMATEEYTEATIRKDLRTQLRSNARQFNLENHLTYQLSYISTIGAEPLVINNSILGVNDFSNMVHSNFQKGYVSYITGSVEEWKKTDFSVLSVEDLAKFTREDFDLGQYFIEVLPETLSVYNFSTSSEQTIYTERGSRVITNYTFSPTSNEVFFLSKPSLLSNTGTLYSATISPTSVGDIIYIDEQVYQIIGNMGGEYAGIVYQTASNDDPPEFIIYSRSSTRGVVEMAAKTSSAQYAEILGEDSAKLLYFRDYSEQKKSGQFFLFDEEEHSLASHVHEYLYLSRGNILLIQENGQSFNLLQLEDSTYTTLDHSINSYHSFDHTFLP